MNGPAAKGNRDVESGVKKELTRPGLSPGFGEYTPSIYFRHGHYI
jgi:hypothetical protein